MTRISNPTSPPFQTKIYSTIIEILIQTRKYSAYTQIVSEQSQVRKRIIKQSTENNKNQLNNYTNKSRVV